MKKLIFTLFVAFMATVALRAQQIAVVNANGGTKLFRTLPDAINEADPGSVIYLPGGGFTISDDVKITKKLTIIGIGHYVKGDNVDGNTTIGGNLHFNEGSSGSAVMGCYITGNVNIGSDGSAVSDVLIRYCNLNSVQVNNNTCMETVVNQNYIRSNSKFNGSNAMVTNNIMNGSLVIKELNNGKIVNNNIFGSFYSIADCNDTQIINNIFGGTMSNGSCSISGNLSVNDKNAEYNLNVDWSEFFVNYNGGSASPDSDFHFKDDYKQYETKCGIYAGSGFKDEQMAPVPYITFKDVPQETDAQGKLNVRIRVSANK